MSKLSVILILLGSIYEIFGNGYVPVILWKMATNQDFTTRYMLERLKPDDFSSYLAKLVTHTQNKKPGVLVFTELNLSIEDFRWKDEAYSFLRNLSTAENIDLEFFPAVHDPIKAIGYLKDINYRIRIFHASHSNNIKDFIPTDGEVLVVKLDDAKISEDRSQMLFRHDAIIHDVNDYILKENYPAILIYTSQYPSWAQSDRLSTQSSFRTRHLLETDDSSPSKPVLWDVGQIMMYSSSAPKLILTEGGRQEISLDTLTMSSVDDLKDFQRLIVKFASNATSYTLRFKFTKIPGYWRLNSTQVEIGGSEVKNYTLFPGKEISAFMGFSYHCSSQMEFLSENSFCRLIVEGIQVQPYITQKGVFGDAADCTYFFTTPIWAGLFVSGVFTIIMIFGLMFIMDIKTMDRFDDPKGKTITINASE